MDEVTLGLDLQDELGTFVGQERQSRRRHEQRCKEKSHGTQVGNTKDPFGWSARRHPGNRKQIERLRFILHFEKNQMVTPHSAKEQ